MSKLEDMNDFQFGDIIENGWASDDNPTKRGVFIHFKYRDGVLNPGKMAVIRFPSGGIGTYPIDAQADLKRIGTIFDADSKTVAAILGRLRPAEQPPSVVKVKPLQWYRPKNATNRSVVVFHALSPVGKYEAWGGGGWNLNNGPNVTGGPRSIEAAMAACQADCESRILSSIETIAIPEGWKLVPVTATPEMRAAGGERMHACNSMRDNAAVAYEEMVHVAPTLSLASKSYPEAKGE